MDWSERARGAALALSTGEEREDDSTTALLLRDIHFVFALNGYDAYKTADLLAELHSIEESPWGDWYGKTLSSHGLSRLLRPYRIKTMTVYVGAGESARGYKREQFADAFARVLGVRSDRSDRSEAASDAASNASNASNAWYAEGGVPERPLIGDEMYPVLLANAVRDGHLTGAEAEQQLALHKLVAESPAA